MTKSNNVHTSYPKTKTYYLWLKLKANLFACSWCPMCGTNLSSCSTAYGNKQTQQPERIPFCTIWQTFRCRIEV